MFKDPVVRTIIVGVLLIAASIPIYYIGDVTSGSSPLYSILFLPALVLSYLGVNSLWKVIFGENVFNFSSILTGFFGVATIKTAKCGNCGQKLGGKEYRHQLRHGYSICSQCGARIEKYTL